MMRIHLTGEDLARTRVVATLGPLAETVASLGLLRAAHQPVTFGGWWARTSRLVTPRARELATFLHPCPPLALDLFTLVGEAASFAEGRERLLAARPADLHAELTCHGFADVARPAWLRGIDGGDRSARQRLADVLTETHHAAVAPYWSAVRRHQESRRRAYGQVMADGGLDQLFATLHTGVRWRPPFLEIASAAWWAPAPLTVHLGGRGLVLVPSTFSRFAPQPYFPLDRDAPAVLLFPAPLDPLAAAALWSARQDGGALAVVLGRTRAAVLEAVGLDGGPHGCTTTELACRLGISPSGASQHATALREAGLLASARHRNTMRHTLTALGVALLDHRRQR